MSTALRTVPKEPRLTQDDDEAMRRRRRARLAARVPRFAARARLSSRCASRGDYPTGCAARSIAPGRACSRRSAGATATGSTATARSRRCASTARGASGAVKLVQSAGLARGAAARPGLLSELRHARRRRPGAAWSRRSKKDSKNTANTSVMVWQGRLYAMLEALAADRAVGRRPVRRSASAISTAPSSTASRRIRTTCRRATPPTTSACATGGTPSSICSCCPTTDRRGGWRRSTLPGRDDGPRLHRHRAAPRLLRAAVALAHLAPAARARHLRRQPALAARRGDRGAGGADRRAHDACAASRCRPSTSGTSPRPSSAATELVVDYVRYPDFASNRWLGEVLDGPARSLLGGTLHRAVIDPTRGTLVDEERASLSRASSRAWRAPPPPIATSTSAAHSDDEAGHGMFDRAGASRPRQRRGRVGRARPGAVSFGAGLRAPARRSRRG